MNITNNDEMNVPPITSTWEGPVEKNANTNGATEHPMPPGKCPENRKRKRRKG
jgi:hypothetical protein